jgi:hypothetical protein
VDCAGRKIVIEAEGVAYLVGCELSEAGERHLLHTGRGRRTLLSTVPAVLRL